MSRRNRANNMSDANTDDSLDALREAKPRTILLDYAGKSGSDQNHAHTAPRICLKSGCDPLVLTPGLNKMSAELWAAYQDHPPISALVKSGSVVEVKLEQLNGADLADLAERTFSADAIELLLEHENAKPVTAGRTKRRDAEVVELLERKLAKASKRRPLDMTGVGGKAKDQAGVLATGGEHARFKRLEREGALS